MTEANEFEVGDNVMAAAGVRGQIVDITEMSSGEKAYGIVDTTGAIRYYVAAGLKTLI